MKIVIENGLDFTPKGKRTARYVQTQKGTQLRWYVGGRLFVKGANAKLTSEWLENEGAPNHWPQPWSAFE